MIEPKVQSIGARLRLAREQSGLSLREIADRTKLTVRVLEAVENERLAHLPTGLYRRGAVRAYAVEVGLDPDSIVRAFVAQYPDDGPPPRTVAGPPAPASAAAKPVRPSVFRQILSAVGVQYS